ncbi:hypothetical protein M426DRAFT_72495 [Hypoxylon sp. CI-4A]|nr:hypothetical protein M426DRAFT_72495 [Hypoxylon sp. CI-4A]
MRATNFPLFLFATVYLSSSVTAAAQAALESEFSISPTVASLGISLFVLGYGFGLLILPCLVSIAIFIVLSILAAVVDNVGGLLVLRFFQGFFGSPVLSYGGASLSDIASEDKRPLALYTWACSAFAAASVAPIISGFAVPVLGWRWSLWEIVLANIPTLLLLLVLPETLPAKILYLHAQILRKVDPTIDYRSRAELRHGKSFRDILWRSLIIPWQMHALDPSILFNSVYAGFLYGIYYSFFELFPIVFQGIYGFNLGECGLAYLAVVAAVVLVGIPYCSYIYCYVIPSARKGRKFEPEERLLPALFASVLVPIGLFLFAWTARPDVHWMLPTIGAALTSAGMVIIIQCVFVYLSMSYPTYSASAFAGNAFLRSLIAFPALLWSRPLCDTLGIAKGSSLLGGLCVGGVIGIWILYRFGASLRKRSRFACVNS